MLCPIPPTVTLKGAGPHVEHGTLCYYNVSLCAAGITPNPSQYQPQSGGKYVYTCTTCSHTSVHDMGGTITIVNSFKPQSFESGHVDTLFIKHYRYSTTVCFLCVCVYLCVHVGECPEL